MRRISTGLIASIAVLGFTSSAFAMGDCSWGHAKQSMASTVEEEATTMSTFDGDVKLPETVSDSDEATGVAAPVEEGTVAE